MSMTCNICDFKDCPIHEIENDVRVDGNGDLQRTEDSRGLAGSSFIYRYRPDPFLRSFHTSDETASSVERLQGYRA